MLVKADFLAIDIEPGSVGPGADDESTDGVNIGGLIDAGYKIGSGQGVFVEPQAALAVVHTSIDDVDIFGGTVDFDAETSVRGRLGVRLGYDHTAANQVVYSSDVTASVWQEFNGSNDVTIDAPNFPVFGVSDEPGETVGDISLGFSVAAPEGWSGFLRGNYQFSDDLEAIAGNLGLRYSW
jgi:outer membrane autotransporter protein